VNVARTQGAAFQIAELVEQKQGMIAGAAIMPVPDAVLLFAKGRADARIQVEQRTASMNAVDPLARQVAKSGKVLVRLLGEAAPP